MHTVYLYVFTETCDSKVESYYSNVTTAVWVPVSHRPSQMSFSELKKNPLGHWQVKLPGVFLHRPFSHRSLFTTHSSISWGRNMSSQLVWAGAALRPAASAQQPTYRRSSSPSGPPQSLRCTRICTSSACSRTRRSGRCRGRGRTRWYLRRRTMTLEHAIK